MFEFTYRSIFDTSKYNPHKLNIAIEILQVMLASLVRTFCLQHLVLFQNIQKMIVNQ